MQYEYLELRYYNDTSATQEAVLENRRYNNLLDKKLNWDMSVIRFDTTNTKIPCFIPRIEKPKDDIFKDSHGDYHAQFYENPESWEDLIKTEFPTNLQVMIQYTDDISPAGTKNKLVGGYIKWIPENVNEPKPVNLDRRDVFQNKYFHSYSQLHLSELLAIALDRSIDEYCDDLGITVDGNTQVDTIDDKLVILLPKALYNYSNSKRFDIIINQELKSLYGFNTVPHPSFKNAHVIKRNGNEQLVRIGYNDYEYYVIPCLYNSSKMFPYKNLTFTTPNFAVEPMMRNNNAIDENNDKITIITDFLLSVDKINNFYDTLVYQPESYDRKIMVDASSVTNEIKIVCMLESPDGLKSSLLIPPQGSCSILLQFSAQSME